MTEYVKEYHSAVKGVGADVSDKEPLERYESDGSVVLQHDIHDGVNPIFREADALYAEPAWRHGYEKFMEKADHETPNDGFERYMMRLNNTAEELEIPSLIIGGQNNLNWLKPDDIHEVHFESHDTECYAMLWNDVDPPRYDVATVSDALNWMADSFDTLVDPCAGTGRVARAMADRNKRFICADVNPRCVRFIADDVMDYS